MASIAITYKIYNLTGKNAGKCKIKIRFVHKSRAHGNIDKEVTIPYIELSRNEWTGSSIVQNNQRFKIFETIKNELQLYISSIEHVQFFNIVTVKEIINRHNPLHELIYLVDNFKDSLKSLVIKQKSRLEEKVNPIKKSTYKGYRDVEKVYLKFLSKNPKFKNYSNLQLNQKWFESWQEYIFTTYTFYSATTYRKNLMCLVRKIIGEKQYKNCEYKIINVVKKPNVVCKQVLNQQEIYKIFNSDFSKLLVDWTGFEKYENRINLNDVKIMAMIGWHTGMRFSADLSKMTYENVNFEKNIIRYDVTKTGQEDLKVPMMGIAKKYLRSHNPIPTMSDELLNAGLKIIGRTLGMTENVIGRKEQYIGSERRVIESVYERWELFASHMLRRSFATWMFKKKDKSNVGHVAFVDSLMKLTGHKKLATFLNYVNITNDERVEYLKIGDDDNEFDFLIENE